MTGFEAFLNGIKGGVALTEFEQGSTTAIEGLKTAVENARNIHDDYAAASMAEKLGDALLRIDRREEAEHYLDEALGYFRKSGMSPYVASTLRILARLYEQAGRTDAAAAAREESATILMSIASAAFPVRQRESV
jgi:tetratricopeptide (TPR) repeat protein